MKTRSAAAALAAALSLCGAGPALEGTWTTGPPLPSARSETAVAAIGTRIYVVGGYAPAPHPVVAEASGHADVDSNLCEVLDVATQRWSRCAPLPRGMNHVGMTASDGRLYAFGGFVRQNQEPVADAETYDPATDRWRPIASLPRALGSISVAVLDGKIHLVGGRGAHSVSLHEVYDPASNTYRTAMPLRVGRDHMGLVAFRGKLYAIAGRIDTPGHNTSYCDRYDPASDRWSSCTPMPSARSGMAVAVYRSRILAIGGERTGGIFTNNEAYDPVVDRWSILAPLPAGRHGTGAAVVGGRLYLPAGAPVNGGSEQSNVLFVFALPVHDAG